MLTSNSQLYDQMFSPRVDISSVLLRLLAVCEIVIEAFYSQVVPHFRTSQDFHGHCYFFWVIRLGQCLLAAKPLMSNHGKMAAFALIAVGQP